MFGTATRRRSVNARGANAPPVEHGSERRSPKVAEVLPILNLRGSLFTGDFKDALGARVGDDASGLLPTSITRLVFLLAGRALGVMATGVEA